jgi:hypothetical protein
MPKTAGSFMPKNDSLFVRLDNRWSNDFMTLDPEARGN